ncbi:MAG: efflux transporter outer membrane subunit [Pseudomonas sp.]|nr:efflux transporter outer membrane subunit [Pseudomonas sp.]
MLTNRYLLLLPLLLAGCSLNSPVPESAVVAPPQWSHAPAGTQWPDRDWWRAYQSPALADLLSRAETGNLDLAAAASRLSQAEAQLRQARALSVPQVGVGLDVSRNGDSDSSAATFGASLSTSYQLDFWGRNQAIADSAIATLLASEFDSQTLAISIQASVVSNWLQILENQQRLALARDSLANAERVLDLVQARYRFGAADSLQVSQQRTLVAQLRASLPSLEQQALLLRNSLALLLGQTPEASMPAVTPLLDVVVPAVSAGLPSDLIVRRPDIRASEARLAAANANVTAARAALFPDIALTGRLGAQSAALGTLVSSPVTGWALAAGLTQSIFDGGALRAQVALSEARQQELLVEYRGTLLGALGETDTALGAAQQAEQRYRFLEQANAEARRAFDLAEIRYRAGSIDLQALLDTQRTWYQSQDTLTQQRAAWLLASVDLFRALGGGWQAPPVVYGLDELR